MVFFFYYIDFEYQIIAKKKTQKPTATQIQTPSHTINNKKNKYYTIMYSLCNDPPMFTNYHRIKKWEKMGENGKRINRFKRQKIREAIVLYVNMKSLS